MSARDDGGPAFPVPIRDFGPDFLTGMSLRDWFAGMAMQGFMASSAKACPQTCRAAYQMADAMLAERAK